MYGLGRCQPIATTDEINLYGYMMATYETGGLYETTRGYKLDEVICC